MFIKYYPLINKVMTALNLRGNEELLEEVAFGRPFITFAREPGSGGAPIAQRVAEKIGFQYVDEQIIRDIANSTKKRKAIVKAIDEKSRTRIEDMIHALLNREYMDDVEYISELVKVVLTYASKGHVVILGRGANVICPFARGLHVNVVAPYRTRVKRAMQYEGFDQKTAKSVIAKVEKERSEFVKQYFKKDIADETAYDITINTDFFSIEDAANIITEAFYRKFPAIKRYKAIFSPV